MVKKIIITLALVVPTVFLCTILVMNQSSIGSNKDFIKKEYAVEGMTCEGCEFRVKDALNGEFVSVESVDFDTKRVILFLDPHKMTLSLLNQKLSSSDYLLILPPKGSLKVLDYQIKYN